ncbi:ribonuclease H [Fusarium sp. NRRL 25303]|nr:ribonuclease H [Fusarium sp. NRRL 25303]
MITETTGWCEAVEHCDVDEPPVASIEVFNPDDSTQRIRYFAGPYQLKKDVSSVIIQIDGVCRGNETQYARGGWGVCFGPDSQYNKSGLLPPDAPQNSTLAELYALMIALETIRDELPLYPERVFIMSDSSYLAQAFTEHQSLNMSTPEDFLTCESCPSEEEEDYEDEEEVEYVEVNTRFDPSNAPILQDTAYEELIKFNPEKQGEDGSSLDVSSEIGILMQALEYIDDLQRFVNDINMFVIAMDDASLVELATEEVRIMARDEDFRKWGSGQPHEYHELWNAIDRQAHGYRHDEGVQYRFWLIPEEMNQEARILMDCKLNPDDHDDEDVWNQSIIPGLPAGVLHQSIPVSYQRGHLAG